MATTKKRGRRKNGEGTWTRRERTMPSGAIVADWRLAISVGIDVETGRYVRREFYGKTQAEARLKYERARDEAGGTIGPKSELTVEAYLRGWLADVERLKTGPTARFYAGRIHKYAIPAIGKIMLADLKATDIEKMYRALDKKGVSADNVGKLHRGLRRAFNLAIGKNLMRANPTSFVERRQHRPEKRLALDAAQVNAFFRAIAGNPFEAMFRLGIMAAMRPGELYALAWDHVDLDAGVVHVQHSLEEDAPRKIVPAKADSERYIPIEPETIAALKSLAYAPRGIGKGPYVFVTPRGTWIGTKDANAALKAACEAADVPRMTMYNLRHTGVSLLGEAGVGIRTISDIAGHADSTLTIDTYSHTTAQMRREAIERAAAIIAGAAKAAA